MESEEIQKTLNQQPGPQPQSFEQYCLLELFGHQRIAGLVSEATIGGCAFIRVDVPDETGEGVRYTKFYGNGAIYAMTVTTKADAVRIANALHPKPPTPRTETRQALPEYTDAGGDDDDDI